MQKDSPTLNKIKNILTHNIESKLLYKFIQIVLVFFSFIIFYLNFESIYFQANYELYDIFLYSGIKYTFFTISLIIVYSVIIWLILGNTFLTYVLMSIISFVTGVINLVFYQYRGELLSIKEIKNIREGMKASIDFSRLNNPYILLLFLFNIIIGICVYRLGFPTLNRSLSIKRIIKRCICIVILILFCFYEMNFIALETLIENRMPGAVLTLSLGVFDKYNVDSESVEVKKIEGIYHSRNYGSESSYKCPNIIVIMSEAFWNTDNFIDSISFNEKNPMEIYNQLAEQSISGECAVDIFGGGTVQSEFEFNTGSYLGNPYEIKNEWYDFSNDNYNTFVTFLKDQGYYTVGLHPYDKRFYDRENVYKHMGFDEFYNEDDFMNKDICLGYISDMSLTNEILFRFEEQKKKKPNQPVYFFAVSLQNHVVDIGTKEGSDYERVVDVKFDDPNIDDKSRNEITKYANGIYYTGIATRKLIEYFNSYDEDTMIVFFGDHAPLFPSLSMEIYKSDHKYKTPYFIWTNYENDYYNPGDVNLSYLSTIISDYLDMPDTLLTEKNKYLMEKYKINTKYDKTITSMSKKEKKEYLEEMRNEKAIYSYYGLNSKKDKYLWFID